MGEAGAPDRKVEGEAPLTGVRLRLVEEREAGMHSPRRHEGHEAVGTRAFARIQRFFSADGHRLLAIDPLERLSSA